MRHERFAERAEERLRAAAERLEGEARVLDEGGGAAEARARAGEMRVAALLVRGEAEAVSRSEEVPADGRGEAAEAPPLRAQA